MIFLLDTPALVALCCTADPQHKKITAWTRETGIATCPFTQAGLLSSPAIDVAGARRFLDKLFNSTWHIFWPCDLRIFAPQVPAFCSPGEMVTAYLLALAGSRAAKLATLDPAIADDRAVLIKWPNWRRAARLRAFAREVKGWEAAARARAQGKPEPVPLPVELDRRMAA